MKTNNFRVRASAFAFALALALGAAANVIAQTEEEPAAGAKRYGLDRNGAYCRDKCPNPQGEALCCD